MWQLWSVCVLDEKCGQDSLFFIMGGFQCMSVSKQEINNVHTTGHTCIT